MKRAIVIVGPTATGKTDLALSLAKKFNGELVACDSRQVFKGLDIGTGKTPSANFKFPSLGIKKNIGFWEIDGIKIWLYDLLEPSKQFNAFDWAKQASKVIEEIEKRGKLPIIVGGTGLYLNALLKGFDIKTPADIKLRTKLAGLSLKMLQKKVSSLSPARWERLNHSDRNNPRRLIRIIEIESMNPYIQDFQIAEIKFQINNLLKIGLNAPRPYLNFWIDQRVLIWFNQGILEEVKNLINRGVPISKFKEFGLEYSLIVDFFEGKIFSKEELIKLAQTKVKQYAKRQVTWFKKDQEIQWFDITQFDNAYRIEELVRNWYNQ